MIVIVVLLQLFSNVAIGGFGLNRLIHILIAVPSYIVPENKNPAFAGVLLQMVKNISCLP